LKYGFPLDDKCPNVALHRYAPSDRHRIKPSELAAIVREQLNANLDNDCQALDSHGKFGAIGALFKITAHPYGYTFVAKGVQTCHRSHLSHEEQVYNRLWALQGTVVPVYIGQFNLIRDYILGGGAHITRMMLMSYGGEPISLQGYGNTNMDKEWQRSEEELLECGVGHDDLRPTNMLWNAEVSRVMIVDFDRAILYSLKRPTSRETGDQDRDRKRRNVEVCL